MRKRICPHGGFPFNSRHTCPHLDRRLTTPIMHASRIPLSSHDSEFNSTMAPTHPYTPVQSNNCRKNCGERAKRFGLFGRSEKAGACRLWFADYPVTVDEPQAARVGASPLLFDVGEHVDEQRAVHLAGQVDGRVTLRKEQQTRNKHTQHRIPIVRWLWPCCFLHGPNPSGLLFASNGRFKFPRHSQFSLF